MNKQGKHGTQSQRLAEPAGSVALLQCSHLPAITKIRDDLPTQRPLIRCIDMPDVVQAIQDKYERLIYFHIFDCGDEAERSTVVFFAPSTIMENEAQ